MKKRHIILLTLFSALAVMSCKREEVVDNYSGRIDENEQIIAALLNQVRSMDVVPYYSDGSVRLEKEKCTLKVDVSPVEVASEIVDSVVKWEKFDVFSFSIKDFENTESRSIKVCGASVDEEGFVVLSLDCSGLGSDFFKGKTQLSASLHLVAGTTDKKTGYFAIRNCTAGDIRVALDGLYGILQKMAQDPLRAPWFVANLMSDDCYGGGTTDHFEGAAISQLRTVDADFFLPTWNLIFEGIASSNSIIAGIDYLDWTGKEASRKQMLGEAYFFRGLFTFWGAKMWGDIPAYWEIVAPEKWPQQSAETIIYPHILADFLSASILMSETGRSSKYAAKAYLADAYIFYEGFYKKAGELANANPEPVNLPQQEGSTSTLCKVDVVKGLDEIMEEEGSSMGLVEDFRLLWPYTNEYTIKDYDYCADLRDAGKVWVGNTNSEALFGIPIESRAMSDQCANMTSYYTSLCPGYSGDGKYNGGEETFPFAQGLGMGTICGNLYSGWQGADARKKATIVDCASEFKPFALSGSAIEESGYANKKWMECTCNGSTYDDFTKSYTWWGVARDNYGRILPNMGNSVKYDHFADIVLMRYADVLLMHTELTGTADGLNKVRARAGLTAASYSWDNIKSERRYEFAGEGIRFDDLRRWSGIGEGVSSMAAVALQKKDGSRVYNNGRWAKMSHPTSSSWADRYSDTDGFLQIPESVIREVGDESILKQNRGWETSESGTWLMTSAPVYPAE